MSFCCLIAITVKILISISKRKELARLNLATTTILAAKNYSAVVINVRLTSTIDFLRAKPCFRSCYSKCFANESQYCTIYSQVSTLKSLAIIPRYKQ